MAKAGGPGCPADRAYYAGINGTERLLKRINLKEDQNFILNRKKKKKKPWLKYYFAKEAKHYTSKCLYKSLALSFPKKLYKGTPRYALQGWTFVV